MHQIQLLKLTVAAVISITLPLLGERQPGYAAYTLIDDLETGPLAIAPQNSTSGLEFKAKSDATDTSPHVDLCQLVLTTSLSEVVVSKHEKLLTLFNEVHPVSLPKEEGRGFSFSGHEGDIFFMAVSGGNPIIHETFPLTLVGWGTDSLATVPAFIPYEVTLQDFSGVLPAKPDPTAILGLALIGGLAIAKVVAKERYPD